MNSDEVKIASRGIEELSALRASVQALTIEMAESRVLHRETQKRAESERLAAEKERAEIRKEVAELGSVLATVQKNEARRMGWIAGVLALGTTVWGIAQAYLALTGGQ